MHGVVRGNRDIGPRRRQADSVLRLIAGAGLLNQNSLAYFGTARIQRMVLLLANIFTLHLFLDIRVVTTHPFTFSRGLVVHMDESQGLEMHTSLRVLTDVASPPGSSSTGERQPLSMSHWD